jgi:NAD(P)H-nitrite reductase large subunit
MAKASLKRPKAAAKVIAKRPGKPAKPLTKAAAKAAAKGQAKAARPARRHVIVGAGTAGINAIRTLRQLGGTGEITLVAAERPYSRMVLPYYLDGSIGAAHAGTASPTHLERWGVKALFGRRAAGLDTAAGKLKLDNGDEVPYDDLLIATGSSAARPPVPGADAPGVHSFWTLADAEGLSRAIAPNSHVVMVGAGFIAFTILGGIMQRAGRVTIVEVASRILPRMIDDAGAALVGQWLQAKGVTLRAGTTLQSIQSKGGKPSLALAGGGTLDCDAVVMATGIRPNLEWLKGSPVQVNHGIVVDDRLRSSVPNVYAAGDVAEAKNLIGGAREVHAIEPTAMDHGRVVGANMAGKDVRYAGSLLMNIVSVAGLDIASFGAWDDPQAEVITGHAPARHAYRKYLFRGERLVGAILVSPNAETWSGNDLGMLKGLVQAGRPLGAWKAWLRQNPFDIKKPYLAGRTVSALLPHTTLGQASPSPRE